MNKKPIAMLMLFFLIGIQQQAYAITPAPNSGDMAERSHGSETRFGLTGTITGWDEQKDRIYIDRRPYGYSRLSGANPKTMKKGLEVFFNLEKSSPKDKGTVTKIWPRGKDE